MKTILQSTLFFALFAVTSAFAQQAAQPVITPVQPQGAVTATLDTQTVVPAAGTTAVSQPSAAVALPAPAEQNGAAASVAAANADASFVAPVGGGLEKIFDQYAADHHFTAYGHPVPGTRICYYKAQQEVQAADRSDFAQKRSIAFSRAYNKAVIEHIYSRYGYNISKETGNIAADDSSDRAEMPVDLDQAQRGLCQKVKALAEAEVDAKLKNLGVDPSQYSAKPLEAKRDLYRDTLVRTSMQKAFGSCAGLSVANTFEGHEGDLYIIGVVVKYDPAFEEIARAMSHGVRPNVAPKQGVPATTILAADANKMVQTFGTRLYYDENGEPALLSFGQWGCTFTGNDLRKQARWQNYALEQAYNSALMDMDFFLSGTLSYEGLPELGADFAESLSFTKENGSLPTPDESEHVLSRLQKKFIKAATAKMQGRGKVYSKLIQHPNGAVIAVSAVNWSYAMLDAQQATPPPKTPVNMLKNDSGTSVRSGIDFDF